MNLLEAMTELVIFARESGGEERPGVARAIRRLEPKMEKLRIQRIAHAARRSCPRCGRNCNGIVCWQCFQLVPGELKKALDAQHEEPRREAVRAVIEWARREKEAA